MFDCNYVNFFILLIYKKCLKNKYIMVNIKKFVWIVLGWF